MPVLEVIPVESLRELHAHLSGYIPIQPQPPLAPDQLIPSVVTDFQEGRGQEHVKRTLEVAAAVVHNMLLIGPPGAGKTLLAFALPGILPRMSIDEALDVTRI